MSETNSYNKATDSPSVRTFALTPEQTQQAVLALTSHADQLYENLMWRPTMANQEKLNAAREALRLLQEA